MRVILENEITGWYYSEEGVWTHELNRAKTFTNSFEASDYAIDQKVRNAQILLKFENGSYDLKLPVLRAKTV